MAIKFRKFFCERGGLKRKVWYHRWINRDGTETLMVSDKGYGYDLFQIFEGVPGIKARNDTDMMSDYFDKTGITILPECPYYAEIRALTKGA